MTVTVQNRQTLSDIAIQVYGDIRGIEALMEANSISATDALIPGTVLECPEREYDRYMRTYVSTRGITPATAEESEENGKDNQGDKEEHDRPFYEELGPEDNVWAEGV